jgi:hypothetical protein
MQAELAACAAGDPVVLHDKIAAQTFEAVGVDKVGWFAYSTIIQKIAAEEPDIFDARPSIEA